ncbi:radical SAM protein [Desulforhabdus sp. TSK]|uniref:B12-binding domain-containing radical SAM protein n=1 Tax=Desulforhabdus sp. TSK TaxID=2925014 RepID=UPI001FC8CAA6|nr:radical SAM protein [Desulforhabdus sp. TSK]GKT10681.1 B12-binding domain-containing radical SAM protein [Desulforhabdus sp. TSK]
MTDVLLIQPPIRDFYLTAKRTIPYGLACIAAALMKESFSVEILDGLATSKSRIIPWPDEMDYLRQYYGKPDTSPFGLFHSFRHFGFSFHHLGEAARQSGAFLVGIASLFTAYSDEAMKTAEAVKAAHPHCTVVVGGHHATEMPEEVLQCRAVDYVLRGEGEVSMPQLARAVREGIHPSCIPGIAYREGDGTIRVQPPAFMQDLDAYPLPAMSLIRQKFYRRGSSGSTVVMASRGCPMRCTYCSMGAASSVPYRRRSVGAVLKEVEEAVVNQGAGFIDFEDENISLQKEWFLKLLKGIQERCGAYSPELRAMNGLFPPTLDEETIAAMQKAGFKALNLSLGTVAPEQLRRFQRPDVREAFDRALACAEKTGLEAVGYVIVGAPDQDPRDSIGDLLFLASRRVLAGVSVYYPSPGSSDFRKCHEAQVLPPRLSLMRSTAIPVSHTTTREESVTLLRLGRILNFMKLQQWNGMNPIEPRPFSEEALRAATDRMERGVLLLQAFLHDGIIRGVTPEGEVYAHKTSTELCGRFIEGLKKIDQIL